MVFVSSKIFLLCLSHFNRYDLEPKSIMLVASRLLDCCAELGKDSYVVGKSSDRARTNHTYLESQNLKMIEKCTWYLKILKIC